VIVEQIVSYIMARTSYIRWYDNDVTGFVLDLQYSNWARWLSLA